MRDHDQRLHGLPWCSIEAISGKDMLLSHRRGMRLIRRSQRPSGGDRRFAQALRDPQARLQKPRA
jgi:hypothetical protein